MMRATGEMPEWPNGTDSKSVVLATVPRVQIPISPPLLCMTKPLKWLNISGAFSFSMIKVGYFYGKNIFGEPSGRPYVRYGGSAITAHSADLSDKDSLGR